LDKKYYPPYPTKTTEGSLGKLKWSKTGIGGWRIFILNWRIERKRAKNIYF
jgi:hypothetical protein